MTKRKTQDGWMLVFWDKGVWWLSRTRGRVKHSEVEAMMQLDGDRTNISLWRAVRVTLPAELPVPKARKR